ncbi:hypothetical protein TrST_g5769 [Triparma strigata]|uniref:Uncharacterized protein n=1 Tax=Triparma strigata TaxID=1606541 RepID=A0A9W6ZGT5_9STRA|nr:hypothetical protein TrST_g5769 [Triparma strigata]
MLSVPVQDSAEFLHLFSLGCRPSVVPMSLSLALGTFLATLTGFLLIFRRLFLPAPGRFLLISLPYSHFVELARWSLKLNPNDESAYDEIKFPIGPHSLFVPIFRLLFGGTDDSSSLPGYSSSVPFSLWQLQPRFLRKLMGLPFTVDSNGKSYSDSWSHLEIANLTIEDDFKFLLDDILGPAVRQVAYNEIFASNMQFYREIQPGVTPQRGMWFLMLIHDIFEKLFKVTSVMRSLMALNDEQVSISSERIIEVFQKCNEILARHQYLGSGSGSDTFGGADLAFSALAAWAVLPPNLGDPEIPSHLLKEKHFGPKFIAFRSRLRSHKAFQHVLHCYKIHRP